MVNLPDGEHRQDRDCQINCVVGDLAGNTDKILRYCDRARTAGADLILTPELALCGYPPEDLCYAEVSTATANAALQQLAREVRGITLVVGHPHEDQGKRHNAAFRRKGRADRGHVL